MRRALVQTFLVAFTLIIFFLGLFGVVVPVFADSTGICNRVVDKPKDPKQLTPADILVMEATHSCPAGWATQSTSVVDHKTCLILKGSSFGFHEYDTTKKCPSDSVVKDVAAFSDPGAGGTKPITDPSVAFPNLNEVIGTLDNPLGVTTVVAFGLRVARILVSVIGIAATAMIIIAALTMIAANGNTKLIAQAKTTLLYAFLGFILALMSFSIVAVFQNLLQSRL